MQQDNKLKHISNSTKKWLRQKKFDILDWPSQSPDFNPIEMLLKALKRAVHARKPTNITQLKQFCKKKWAKIPPTHCTGLFTNYQNYLVEGIAAQR